MVIVSLVTAISLQVFSGNQKTQKLAAALPPLDSVRIIVLRDSAFSGQMDSAAILATQWPPPGKSEWLTNEERSYWLAIASYGGAIVAFNQESLLAPGNRRLRLGILKRIKSPVASSRNAFCQTLKLRYAKLGDTTAIFSQCKD